MKKFLLTLGVGSLALSSFATTRILYQQNFENVADAAEAGWSFGGASQTIASDEFGKFLELALGQNNGRSGKVTWGQDIFLNDEGQSMLEDGTYTLSYDFCIATGSNNQYNGAFTIFTNHTGIDNQPYRNPWATPINSWETYLFDMSQVNGQSLQYAVDAPAIGGDPTAETPVAWSIDTSEPTTFADGAWYTVELNVDVENREVEYTVLDVNYNIVKTGVRTVPETQVVYENGEDGLTTSELPVSMYAEGMFLMLARYQTTIRIDNIKISYETSEGYANDPTIALTGVGKTPEEELDLNFRQYTITFIDGETLHVTGTDGQTVEVDYADCDGEYKYNTSTSGTLKAWTTCDGATSQVVEVEVDCTPIVLPEVVSTISAVSEGYAKTYTFTVSNESVPLRPTIFISYKFDGVSGQSISGSDEASGFKLSVEEAGTLTVTSEAFGFESKSVTVENDIEFETKKVYDFARMTQEELAAALGVSEWKVLNSATTSGFNNWTARKRLYYNIEGTQQVGEDGTPVVDDNGNAVLEVAYPFGFLSEDNTVNVINYIEQDANETGEGLFQGLTVFAGQNVSAMYRIGIYNNATAGGNYKNIIVKDLDKDDFVVVNYINDYGSNSVHPVCATAEDYYALLGGDNAVYSVAADGVLNEETGLYDVTHPLYRIDTACTKITVFQQAGSQSGVAGVEAEVEGDNWYYSIDGVRMAQPTRPGIYIHNGKKVIVK